MPEYSGDATTRNWSAFFWIGLAGIVATGLIVGMGGDNFWAIAKANPPFGSLPIAVTRGTVVFFAFAVLVGLFDICAAGVIFAGGSSSFSVYGAACRAGL